MTTTRPARPGLWPSILGAALLLLAAGLLVPGIDALNTVRFGDDGGSPAGAYWLIGAGGLALLVGGALLATGRRRHATDMDRARTYDDQREDHTITAEDRPQNPNDASLRGYQAGYFGGGSGNGN